VKKSPYVVAVLAIAAVALAVAFQAVVRDREYRSLLVRGDAAGRDDQSFGAIEAYSGAIAMRPDSMLPHLRRGETYLRRGELDQAARDFRAAARLDPTATRPLEALGDVLYQMTRFERAAEAYATRLRLDDRSAPVSYKLALARYRMGDVDGALTTLQATLRLDDRLPDVYYLLALCQRDKQRYAEAVQALQRAIAIAPDHVAARDELADLFESRGRRAEAIDQLRMLARLESDRAERHVALGLAQARAGLEETAVVTLTRALERMPGQPLLYAALGQVWLGRAQAEDDRIFLGKAIEALGRVAASPDATASLLTLYGRALMLDEQFESAEQALQRATTQYPLEPASLVLYAAVAERLGHRDASRQALIDHAALVENDADAVPHALKVASLSIALDDPQTAVVWLERTARMTPGDIGILTELAEAQLRAGDDAGAKASIAVGLEKDPSNARLALLLRRVSQAPSGGR
jgi:tetratricopeptide (TPR) repeat protein